MSRTVPHYTTRAPRLKPPAIASLLISTSRSCQDSSYKLSATEVPVVDFKRAAHRTRPNAYGEGLIVWLHALCRVAEVRFGQDFSILAEPRRRHGRAPE